MAVQDQWRSLVEGALAQVRQARALDAAWPAGTLETADEALAQALGGSVAPPSGPQFVPPLAPGAVYGNTKWLGGSLGTDLFVPRGTPVYAPADCLIEEVLGGAGLSGGDELIISLPDHSWAWRYRHTAATQGTGYRARQGEQVGVVNDSSLDALGRVPAWFPAPDGYQHLDLSVNQGTDQFSPQGGGGGNVSAAAWLQAIGYVGTVWSRTPGPPDAGH